MNIFQAILLGIVQGLTEFLPVSSSGHLILVPAIFGWNDIPDKLSFDVALHFGTTLAVLLYFWRDWVDLLLALKKPNSTKARLLYFIILGSVPAGILGLLFDDFIENTLRSPYVVIFNLAFFAGLLWLADRVKDKGKKVEQASLIDSLIVGTTQAIALMPGVSRSGITITTGLFRGLNRSEAARFSFLLSTPIILALSAYKSLDFVTGEVTVSQYPIFLAGMLTSAVVGYLAISFLLKFVQKNSFKVFIIYRIVLALVILFLVLNNIIL